MRRPANRRPPHAVSDRVVTKMSDEPSGPGARPNSSVPPRHESDGRDSAAAVFTAVPAAERDDRVA